MAYKKTTRGSIILKSGERITKSEQKALQRAVRQANKRAREYNKRLKETTELHGGIYKTTYNKFGKESNFLLRKKSARISRFTTKHQYKQYLKNVKRQARGQTEQYKMSIYKENYIKALQKAFGSMANKVVAKVRKLSPLEIRNAYEMGDLESIGYVYYDPYGNKLQQIEAEVDNILGDREYYQYK